jgi:hypothetical protein
LKNPEEEGEEEEEEEERGQGRRRIYSLATRLGHVLLLLVLDIILY